MLQIVLAVVLAAAPAAEKKPVPPPPPPPPAAADDGHGHDHDHDHAAKDEKPLDETGKKMVAVSEALAAITHENLAAYRDMVAAARDSKDCAATAKEVSARSKKLETDLVAKKAKADGLRKGLQPREQQESAGMAIIALKDELAKTRAGIEGDSNTVLGFRGKCPKQADEVDKAITAIRKRVVP